MAELVFTAYPIQPTFLAGQVLVGPCVCNGIFQTANVVSSIFTFYDGRNAGGRIIMRLDSLSLGVPMSSPDINIKLESGLFVTQTIGSGWTFLLAKLP